MPSSSEIRQQFIDFFAQRGHAVVPSSPVVPLDDPTLLFANAGMNQFKPYFLGTQKPPYNRAVNTQKCIRAGGKHNDLDDVGRDTYHHTFFEMLGNWSFGDYFKKEAIAWAWELLTQVWKLDPARLHVTVFEGDPANGIPRDDEAAGYWLAVGVPGAHIHLGNKKDNFWEMGSTGPCGPCTEVHYDATPDKGGARLVNAGSDQVIEIWNLVFIQFNRNEDQSLTPLPAQHVDTGMGFERVTKILQGKSSNYDTDIFTPLMASIREVTGGRPYGGRLDDRTDTAYRVIADHIRALTFALTDGAAPSNEGRGSVLRSILRRAVLFGWLDLGMREPFLHKLVPAVVANFGRAFPELARNPERVRSVVSDEESGFLRTIDRGLKLYDDAASFARTGSGVIPAKQAFDLHTEQGFFIDITEKLAADAGLKVDRAGFDRLMEEFREKSRSGTKFASKGLTFFAKGVTNDSMKYETDHMEDEIAAWVEEGNVEPHFEGDIPKDRAVGLLTNRTCFYAEAGGQVGDRGEIRTQTGVFTVQKTVRNGDNVVHWGKVKSGEIKLQQTATLLVDPAREEVKKHHTATHLLNLALRQVLGEHVEQKGSLVDEHKTRFDFSHDRPLSAGELQQIEHRVNTLIGRALPVTAKSLQLAKAKQIRGVRAVFGEKYPDPVRVVLIGPNSPEEATLDDSVEFCGGTHVPRTSEIGYFKIISQEGVAKGVRRVTAVAGHAAAEMLQKTFALVDELAGRFQCKPDELPARAEALQHEVKKLQAQLKKGVAADLAGTVDKLLDAAPEVNGAKLVVGQLPAASVDQVRAQIDRIRQKTKSAFVVFGWADDDGKVPVIVALTSDLTAKGLKAGDIVKQVAAVVGGSGGGKPDLAQAGGKDATKLPEAMAKAMELGRSLLGN